MSIKDRLTRLEGRARGPSRCENCHDWPEVRVEALDWRTNLPVEPETPARCPSCGFEPTTVVIEDLVDWRSERDRNPRRSGVLTSPAPS